MKTFIALLLLGPVSVHATLLIDFDFTGEDGTQAFQAPETPITPGLTGVSNLTRGPGLDNTGGQASRGVDGFKFRPFNNNLDETLSEALTEDAYLGFSFTVAAGFEVSLDSLDFGFARQDDQSRYFHVFASVDGGTTGFAIGDLIDSTPEITGSVSPASATGHSLTLSGDSRLLGIQAGTTVDIRLYYQ